MLKERGIIIHAEDANDYWAARLEKSGLNVVGIHPAGGHDAHHTMESFIKQMETPQWKKFADRMKKAGIAIEYEMHALSWIMERNLFHKYPDWFRMDKSGNRVPDFNCCASNEEAMAHIRTRSAELAHIFKPDTHKYYFWIDDIFSGKCLCEKCRDLSPSDQALKIYNAIAEGLKSADPLAKASYLAYCATLEAPAKVIPNENIFLEFAPFERDLNLPLFDTACLLNAEQTKTLPKLLEVFGKKDAKVLDYWADNSLLSKWTLPPKSFELCASAMVDDVAQYKKLGFECITSFGCYLGENYAALYGDAQLDEYYRILEYYTHISDWEFYAANFETEYAQSMEEGLDIEMYKDVFLSAAKLPKSEFTKKLGDVLFEVISKAGSQKNYPFLEPSDLPSIRTLRKPFSYKENSTLDPESQIHGAWLGRVCGCMLGKTVEGIHTDELIPFLKETGNFPMHRYILRSDLNDAILNKYRYGFANRDYVDTSNGMPADDDTNYTVLYQEIIQKYGRDFTPADVAQAWLDYQPKNAYCTAERVAYCNFSNGILPPASATYKNPYREWIGAQIRGDYFGYINPGNPELAAEMAWRDASVSHTKNGIYGEMFIAAMLAVAAKTNNIEDIIQGGLAQIPQTSRLYAEIMTVLETFHQGITKEECFKQIHEKYDEHTSHGWCHTISNAMIVAACLLYGNSDYGKSICMAVQAGFDTDCNAATVGSILGMANGIQTIPECWSQPINDTLQTAIYGIGTVKISDRAKLTMEHLA